MKKLILYIDNAIAKETMYRMVIYGLGGLVAVGALCSFIGIVHFSGFGIIISTIILLAICYITNKLFVVVFDAQSNYESWLISALILVLILPPVQTALGAAFVALAGVIAMTSKYIITYHHRHIFNPAAFAAFVLTVTGWLPAIWWVGTPLLVIFSATFGIILLRKLRRYMFFGIFAVTACIVALSVGLTAGQTIGVIFSSLLLSSPLIFFGTIMVTEPETMPNGTARKWVYAVLVGALVSSQLHVGQLYATPELSLVIGNIVAFLITIGACKQQVRLKERISISSNLREYVFVTKKPIKFIPGQYMEMTLSHNHTDSRGNRRTFSITSEPHSTEIRFATKLFEKSSSFKKELENLKINDVVTLSQLNGSFVLPYDSSKKVAFIAGGIGITPFVSMARDMVSNKTKRDAVLFYLVTNQLEFAYKDLWQEARKYGLKVIPILTDNVKPTSWHGLTGKLSVDVLKRELPDFKLRHFYISGPHGLVVFYSQILQELSITKKSIHSDFFSGY